MSEGHRAWMALTGDERRRLNISTRSRALLRLAGKYIESLEQRPPSADPVKTRRRREFDRALQMVRAMADKRAVFEVIDGVAYLPPVASVDDWRLKAISSLSALCRVSVQDLDEATDKLASEEDLATSVLDRYIEKLKKQKTAGSFARG